MSRRCATLAVLACLGLAYAVPFPDVGWNQGAHYALVRAIWRGTPYVDRDRYLTGDISYADGHYTATKAPGLALASLPAYAVVRATPLGNEIERHSRTGWHTARITIWLLALIVAVVPAMCLLLLVSRVGDSIEPGFGLAAAVTLGTGTLVLPFATLFFAHTLSALLSFSAFAVLFRARRQRPGAWMAAGLAGLLVALATTTEYSLALVGVPLLVYALVDPGGRAWRAAAYVAGVLLGIVPLLVYDTWAYGSPFRLSYANAVSVRGATGHDVMTANTTGFFGVGWPDARSAIESLISSRGLLALSPVLALSVVGCVLMFRRGLRAEVSVIVLAALALLAFDISYYMPFGGPGPGPRFLVAALPFLAVPLAMSFRALPITTSVLAVVSTVMLGTATVTSPFAAGSALGVWARLVQEGRFQQTALSAFGAAAGRAGSVAFVAAVVMALVIAARATTWAAAARRDVGTAAVALGCWTACVALVLRASVAGGVAAAALVGTAVVAAAVVMALFAWVVRPGCGADRAV
jgi:hypothetical protein